MANTCMKLNIDDYFHAQQKYSPPSNRGVRDTPRFDEVLLKNLQKTKLRVKMF